MDYRELIIATRAGDSTAATQLYTQTVKPVYYTALKLVRNEQDAQDITQDVYVKVFSQLDGLADPQAFPKWVSTIAVNLSKDFLKKCRPALFQTDEEEQATLGAIPETGEEFLPAEWAEQADRRNRLVALIDALSEEQSATVYLHYFDQLSIEEVAQVMEVNENTVKSRLNYARKKLRDQVKDKNFALAPLPLLLRVLQADCAQHPLPPALNALPLGLGATGAPGSAAASTPVAGSATASTTVAGSATAGSTAASSVVAGSVAAGAVAGGGLAAAGSVKAAFLGATLGTKLVAGVLAAALLIGGGVGIYSVATRGERQEQEPVSQTEAPTKPTKAPAKPTKAPAKPTETPAVQTEEPVATPIPPAVLASTCYTAYCKTNFPGAATLLADLTHDGTPELLVLYTDPYNNGNLELFTMTDGEVVPLPITMAGGYDKAQANLFQISWPDFPLMGDTEKLMLLQEDGLDYLVHCSSYYRQGYVGFVQQLWVDPAGQAQMQLDQSFIWDAASMNTAEEERITAEFSAAVDAFSARATVLCDLSLDNPMVYRDSAFAELAAPGDRPLGPKGDFIAVDDLLGGNDGDDLDRAYDLCSRLDLPVWPGLDYNGAWDAICAVPGFDINSNFGAMDQFHMTGSQFTVAGVHVGMHVDEAKKLIAQGGGAVSPDYPLSFDLPDPYGLVGAEKADIFQLALSLEVDSSGTVSALWYDFTLTPEAEAAAKVEPAI